MSQTRLDIQNMYNFPMTTAQVLNPYAETHLHKGSKIQLHRQVGLLCIQERNHALRLKTLTTNGFVVSRVVNSEALDSQYLIECEKGRRLGFRIEQIIVVTTFPSFLRLQIFSNQFSFFALSSVFYRDRSKNKPKQMIKNI